MPAQISSLILAFHFPCVCYDMKAAASRPLHSGRQGMHSMAEHIGQRTPICPAEPTASNARLAAGRSVAKKCRKAATSAPADIPLTATDGILRTWLTPTISTTAEACHSTRPRRAKFSRRSAAVATLAPGPVMWMAISRARATYCGPRIVRRSAISDSRVVVDKRR